MWFYIFFFSTITNFLAATDYFGGSEANDLVPNWISWIMFVACLIATLATLNEDQ